MPESSRDIRNPSDAWDYFVGSQSVEEWLRYEGATTPEGIAEYLDFMSESEEFLDSDDKGERDRIAALLAQHIADQ